MAAPLNPPQGYPPYCLRFLGTAGARFTVMRQIRASGGLWVKLDKSSWVIDPGPGSLVRLCESAPPIDPNALDALLLTHRHIDHSTDMNILAEAMTGGGKHKRGVIVLPEDALRGPEPILYRYLHEKIDQLLTWTVSSATELPGGASVEAVRLAHHGVECVGLIVRHPVLQPWGIISDTRFLDWLPTKFRECTTLVMNVTLRTHRADVDHLSLEDVAPFCDTPFPRLLLLTHMGRGLLESDPQIDADRLTTPSTRVVAARDGMVVDLQTGQFASFPFLRPSDSCA